jgi:hypothetical protein
MNQSILTDPKEKSPANRKRQNAVESYGYSYSLERAAFNARFKKPRIFYDDNLNSHWAR